MSLFHTIILGIVEGLTEFLPISSTAHIDIARTLLSIKASEFIKSFGIIIQLGAILAVIVVYAKRVFSSSKYVRNIIIAFLPTAVIGYILYSFIKSFLLGNMLVQACALIVGGIIIILFENYHSSKKHPETEQKTVEDLSVRQLLTLGVAQSLAVIPGVSRSGAVIISGRALGLSPLLITEFSFLLAVPTILGATLYDIYKQGLSFTSSQWGTIGVGFIVSFIVALIVIRWLLSYIRKHSFKIFGWYRIILGGLLIIAIFFNII
jgi:undecaprenyl-diphosphatase